MKGLSSLFRFGGGMVFGIICWSFVTGATFGTGKPSAPPQINLDPSPLDQEIKLATSFAPVVKKVVSSVVSIKVIQREGIAASPLENDPFWRFFMPDEAPQPRRRETQGVGSGVIVSKDGYILTNNHVVDGAEQITVVLQEGNKEYAADILGVDKHSDLAVLKIDAEDLSPITLTDSRLLEVGDVVLAVGSPFGLAQSVTMGIVSATGRAGLGMMDIENFIQTDASINRGNSGGALVDAQGRLVGINTLIMSRSGGNQGVGFAIPVNMARGVMDQIVQFGNVRRGLLGISMQEMSDSMAKQFGLETNQGVLISDVSQGGPADAGGLRAGDVILRYGDTEVDSLNALKLLVVETRPGTEIPITVFRKSVEKTLQVEIGTLPEAGYMALRDQLQQPYQPGEKDALDGIRVSDINAASQQRYGLPAKLQGALITEVDPQSNAYQAGLRPGQVILQIDQMPVQSAADAVELSRQVEGESALLRIWMRGGPRYIVVPIR